jgi:type IV pilus assembly protein PilM
VALSLRRNTDGGTAGLDIDGRFLACAQVHDGRLVGLASHALPEGALRDGEVGDRAVLAAAIKDFAAEARLPRDVQLGVSNQQIVVRVLELPRIDDPSERDAALRFQAAETIAMPLDEAVLDHQVAGYVGGDDGGGERMRVVVVAARRSMIEEYLGAVRDAGLRAKGIDLDAFALVRTLGAQPRATVPVADPEPAEDGPDPEGTAANEPPNEPPNAAELRSPFPGAPAPAPPGLEPAPEGSARVFCHLGGVTNLAIAVADSCLFSRTLSTSVAGEGGFGRLADEIRLSLDYYLAQPTAVAVGDLILSGQGAGDSDAIATLSTRLGIPVAAAAPLGPFDAAAVPDADDPNRYTIAAGLALGVAA